jgi:NTE family protein
MLVRGVWARSLMRPEPIRELIERLVPVRRFSDLRMPCTITAVETATGREVAFGAGGEDAPLVDVLAATCALPPYFPPVTINGRAFVDGGIRSTVPIAQAEGIACNFVVAVHTAPGFDEQGETIERPPPLVAATDTAMGWLMATVTELQRAAWDRVPGRPPLLWLRPVSDRGAMFAADHTARYAAAGYDAMKQVLEEMR